MPSLSAEAMTSQTTLAMAPQTVANRWAERLTNLVKEHGHLYLLLNRFNGLDERLQPLVDALPEQWPLTDPYFGEAIERAPLLVKLTMAQLPLLDQAALVAAEEALDPAMPSPSVCAWMCAGVSTERLAGQLRRQLDIRLEGRKKSVFFRYFDPGVMSHLPRVFTPAQLARLLGHMSLWVAPGRDGALLELTKPEDEMAPAGLRLSAEQAQALERIDPINGLLKMLGGLGHTIAPSHDHELDALVLLAQQKGHATEADILSYGLHALLISRNFDRLPEVKQAIQSAQAQGLGLGEALDGFDDAFWAANAAELASLRPST